MSTRIFGAGEGGTQQRADAQDLLRKVTTPTPTGRVAIGNAKLLADAGVDAAALEAWVQALQAEGQTVMLVAVDGEAAA